MAQPDADSPPFLVIEPSSPWRTIDLREIWRYRELLYFLAWRDVKLRYTQAVLGMSWAILQPLLGMLIFAFIFGRIARFPSEGVPYAIFAYTALLPWTFFSNAFSSGALSLVNSSNLLTKVYFPRILFPLAAVSAGVVDFFFGFVMLGPLLLLYKTPPSIEAVVWVPVSLLVGFLLVFGFATWTSALVGRFRDLRYVLPFVLQIWLFLTPVFYPLSMIPAEWRPFVAVNPMAGVVEAFRRSIIGQPVAPEPLAWSAFLGLFLIFTGGVYFRRVDRLVADVL